MPEQRLPTKTTHLRVQLDHGGHLVEIENQEGVGLKFHRFQTQHGAYVEIPWERDDEWVIELVNRVQARIDDGMEPLRAVDRTLLDFNVNPTGYLLTGEKLGEPAPGTVVETDGDPREVDPEKLKQQAIEKTMRLYGVPAKTVDQIDLEKEAEDKGLTYPKCSPERRRIEKEADGHHTDEGPIDKKVYAELGEPVTLGNGTGGLLSPTSVNRLATVIMRLFAEEAKSLHTRQKDLRDRIDLLEEQREQARGGEDLFKAQRDSALHLLRWLIGDLIPPDLVTLQGDDEPEESR